MTWLWMIVSKSTYLLEPSAFLQAEQTFCLSSISQIASKKKTNRKMSAIGLCMM